MANFPPRDLESEAAKHFKGSVEERLELALRLGRDSLEIFLATLPPGTTRAEARAILRRKKQIGRRRSDVMSGR